MRNTLFKLSIAIGAIASLSIVRVSPVVAASFNGTSPAYSAGSTPSTGNLPGNLGPSEIAVSEPQLANVLPDELSDGQQNLAQTSEESEEPSVGGTVPASGSLDEILYGLTLIGGGVAAVSSGNSGGVSSSSGVAGDFGSAGGSSNQAIPTPALLPGLIGMGAAALRKKRATAIAKEALTIEA